MSERGRRVYNVPPFIITQGAPLYLTKFCLLTHGTSQSPSNTACVGSKGYIPRRTGERKRKSVRGCIVDNQLSVLNLAVVKKGEAEVEGLTDTQAPRRLGPKRASKIRKLFNLSKKDDVRKYVIRRKIEKEGKKAYSKAPKIQRLVTPQTLQRKRHRLALKKRRTEKQKTLAANYAKLLAKRQQERAEARYQMHQKRRNSSRKSESKDAKTSA